MTNRTPTIRVLSNVGEEVLMEAKVASGSALTSADTIDISGSSVVNSGDSIKIVSVNNITDGTQYSTFTYSKSLRKFTMAGVLDATLSGDEIRVEFRKVA
jgi:hypothetical protein